ncbi:hypothetical protein ABIB82_003162 [Bradyrhizobium sp. i1.8.4]|uniref:hypothetical protein n=1 Tax=unclassified Bradyrhizobium TaxID=2631580 RepID=UPI003D1A7E37
MCDVPADLRFPARCILGECAMNPRALQPQAQELKRRNVLRFRDRLRFISASTVLHREPVVVAARTGSVTNKKIRLHGSRILLKE